MLPRCLNAAGACRLCLSKRTAGFARHNYHSLAIDTEQGMAPLVRSEARTNGRFTAGYVKGCQTHALRLIPKRQFAHLFYDTPGNIAKYDANGIERLNGYGLTNAGPFCNLYTTFYWTGTEDVYAEPYQCADTSDVPLCHYGHVFDFSDGDQTEYGPLNESPAWYVHDGDVGTPVSTIGQYYFIDPASKVVNEGDGTITFTITRTDCSTPVTLYASTVQTYGFTNDGDFIGVLNNPITFSDLSWINNIQTTTVTVQITDDTVAGEGDETFGIILQESPTDPVDTFIASATFTIQDNDGAGPTIFSISAADADKPEGNNIDNLFTFNITRSGDLDQPMEIPWLVTTTAIGVDAADFSLGVLPSGVAQFSVGESTYNLIIGIHGDTEYEPDEPFSVMLIDPPTGTSINPDASVATGIIRNDDVRIVPVLQDVSADYSHPLISAAQLAIAAYYKEPDTTMGWAPVPNEMIGALTVGNYQDGVFEVDFRTFIEGAHLYEGKLDGVPTLAIAFRGTDELPDERNWQGVHGWNELFAIYREFLERVQLYAKNAGFHQLLITGHSLGGALTQKFVAEYLYTDPQLKHEGIIAITFGSPGSESYDAGNNNGIGNIPILNVVHDDDAVANWIADVLGFVPGVSAVRYGRDLVIERPEAAGQSTAEHKMSLYQESVKTIIKQLADSGLPNPRCALMTSAASRLSITSRFSPFFTCWLGISKTEVCRCGCLVSHSHRNPQTSCSRHPVLTLNSAMRCKCSGSSPKNSSCSSHDSGYGSRASSASGN